jgi:hypothetical protein
MVGIELPQYGLLFVNDSTANRAGTKARNRSQRENEGSPLEDENTERTRRNHEINN